MQQTFKNVEYKGINEMNLKENYERFFGKLNESNYQLKNN